LHFDIDGEPAEAEHRYIVAPEPAREDSGHPCEFDRTGADRVIAQNARRFLGWHGDKRLGASAPVVLPGVTPQVCVELGEPQSNSARLWLPPIGSSRQRGALTRRSAGGNLGRP
jgi:hypothetical protein